MGSEMCIRDRSATQTEPKPAARPIGAMKPFTVLVGLFVRGSIRVTTPRPDSEGQWAPAAQTAPWLATTKPRVDLKTSATT